MLLRRSFFLFVTCLSAAACSADDADTSKGTDGLDEEEVRVRPRGRDLPGKLRVVLPDGVSPQTVRIKVGEQFAEPGAVVGGLRVGGHDLRLTSASGFGTRFESRGAPTVKSGELTEYRLAKITPHLIDAPETYGTEEITVWDGGWSQSAGGIKKNDLHQQTSFAVTPGNVTFRFGLGLMDGTKFTAEVDQENRWSVVDLAQRRVARVVAPDARELPDAKCVESPSHKNEWTIVVYDRNLRAHVARVLPSPGKSLDFGAPVESAAQTDYRFSTGLLRDQISLELGAVGTPKEFKLGRIDVDDVETNNGMVKGRYSLHRVREVNGQDVVDPANLLHCQLPTNTGLDVPNGEYTVRVTYATAEAGDKTDDYRVTVP